jgi:molybdenum cofactor cytidylyltransferase
VSHRLGCCVLAAGSSRRLGHPKQLLTVGGISLVRHAALAALAASGESAVVVGAQATLIEPELSDLNLAILPNTQWETGMASSVRTAAAWAEQRELDGVVLMVCDQPRLASAHLQRLFDDFRGGETIVASFYAGLPGVPALFPRKLFAELKQLQGDSEARTLLRHARTIALVQWPDGAVDIDTPEQIAELAQR